MLIGDILTNNIVQLFKRKLLLDNNVQCVTANLNKMFKLPLFVQDKTGSSVTFSCITESFQHYKPVRSSTWRAF